MPAQARSRRRAARGCHAGRRGATGVGGGDLLYLLLGLAACLALALAAEGGAAVGLGTLLAVLAYRLRARLLDARR